jgi:hypothetical protein
VRDPRALLWDARASGDAIERFLSGKDFDDYLADETLRSAVERQFEVLGEALAQLSKADPKLVTWIPDAGNAIGFAMSLFTDTPRSIARSYGKLRRKACPSSNRLSMGC